MIRRHFLSQITAFPVIGALSGIPHSGIDSPQFNEERPGGSKLKISLNAYSFNTPLREGKKNLLDLVDFCAETGFDALDATAYYFPGYPEVPEDAYLFRLKRKAFLAGLEISGTGVRNDFSVPDEDRRKSDIQLVKNWILAASKLGAPVIRIFSGRGMPEGYSREQVEEWMAEDMGVCADFGRDHGVMVAVQNHNEFLKTPDEIIRLISMVDSEWFGLILDIGSLRAGDPYEEIQKVIDYAVSWQIKENVYYEGRSTETDYAGLLALIRESGFRGYLPLETLVRENIEERMRGMFSNFKALMKKYY